MRSPAQSARLIFLLCLATTSVVAAQQRRQFSDTTNSDRASQGARPNQATRSTPNVDGLAILTAALDSRHRIVTRHDCSHFVHDLYEQAGFHYEYASSADLYVGVDEFRQVTTPQPGDLAVWHGHVGIVVNPSQHSFFSLLRSGPGIDLYDSPYWKQRGHPRFFRYAKPAPVAASTPIRNSSWRPFTRTHEEESATNDPASDESVESAVQSTPPAKAAPAQPQEIPAPRAIMLTASKPQPVQVREAFLQACKDQDSNLRGHDLFSSTQSVVVFDQLQVKKVHISGNAGWAEVQIDEPVSLAEKKAQVRKRTEHQRWALTRQNTTSWELTPAPNTLYLTQSTAVRLLASELAQLTERNLSPGQTQEKAQLARLLDALLEK